MGQGISKDPRTNFLNNWKVVQEAIKQNNNSPQLITAVNTWFTKYEQMAPKVDILTNNQSNKYKFISLFTDSNEELENFILEKKPAIIIYNFHGHTTPFFKEQTIRNKYSHIFHIMVHYDLLQTNIDNFVPEHFHGFHYIISDNEKLNYNSGNVFCVTRSVPYLKKLEKKTRNDEIPIIGFQGFGFPHKGICRIAYKIQEEFDEAIFRLHIPYSYFGDPTGEQARARVNEVYSIITKPGIKIEVSHNFFSEILYRVHTNSVSYNMGSSHLRPPI